MCAISSLCTVITYLRIATVSTVGTVARARETHLSPTQLHKLTDALICAAVQTTYLTGSTVYNGTLQHCGIN